jgi:hypothetical protein
MIQRILPVSAAFLLAFFAGADAFETEYKNRLSLGVEQALRYQRRLPVHFWIGTELNYKLIIGSDNLNGNWHLDNQPSGWLIVLTHEFGAGMVDIGNRFKAMSDQTVKAMDFTTYVSKRFELEERWAIAPSVVLFEYSYDPGNLGGNFWTHVHEFGFMTHFRLEISLDY